MLRARSQVLIGICVCPGLIYEANRGPRLATHPDGSTLSKPDRPLVCRELPRAHARDGSANQYSAAPGRHGGARPGGKKTPASGGSSSPAPAADNEVGRELPPEAVLLAPPPAPGVVMHA